MKIIRNLQDIPKNSDYSIITIGNFDGVHIGHQSVIKKLVDTAKALNKKSLLITFSNHPQEVISNKTHLLRINTEDHKHKLIDELGIDLICSLRFTKEFASLSAEEFIDLLKNQTRFSHLILGWDSAFGKNREGHKEQVIELAKKKDFEVHYIEPLIVQDKPISSSIIRQKIQENQIDELKILLKRPYSILSKVEHGQGKGKQIGFPTANINVEGLVLPPLGVYAVDVVVDSQYYRGIVNLGIAPTIRSHKIPILEAHLFDYEGNLYNKVIEVIFTKFIRSEKKFSSVEELKKQISYDIIAAKDSFN